MSRAGRAAAVLMTLCLVLCRAPANGQRAPEPDPTPTAAQERRLVQSFIDMQEGQLEEARRNLSYLLRDQPDFHLARLVYGDLWMAQAGALTGFGGPRTEQQVEEFREEARARLRRYRRSPPSTAVPEPLLRLSKGASSALLVDLEANRLYLFEQAEETLRRTRDFYVSIGKNGIDKRQEGDEKTPVGVYIVSSYIPGSRLPDLYGVGAFPINYPNGWDRIRGRSGGGIWVHGTESDTYSRPPLASRGCVTLSNQDFRLLADWVEVGRTPVIVADRLRWVAPEDAASRRRELEQVVERWRADWESRDSDRYLGHYSESFRSGGMSRSAFAAYKRQVNAGKKYIKVRLEEIGIYGYPGESGLVLVDFVQHYESDSFRGTRRKHQYWRREPAGWRIVLEEKVG